MNSEALRGPARDRIYLIVMNDEFLKVGVSVDPVARLECLQTGNPHQLRLIGSVSGGPKLEREFHKLLRPYWAHREWFYYCSPTKIWARLLLDQTAEAAKSAFLQLPNPHPYSQEVEEIARLTGLSRPKVRDLLDSGVMPSAWAWNNSSITLDVQEVSSKTGLKPQEIERLTVRRRFPSPIGAGRWMRRDIEAWMDQCVAQRDALVAA